MNIRQIVAELPPTSEARRVVEACLNDLHIPEAQLCTILGRTHLLVQGLVALDRETWLATGGRSFFDEQHTRMLAGAAEIVTLLTKS